MPTLRKRSSREDVSALGSRNRPVLLATLDVPYAEEATAFAVDSAVENGQPLLLVNVAEVLPTAYSLLGYGYVERESLQEALRLPAELARSLAVPVERLRVCSPHPIDALLEVAAERNPAKLRGLPPEPGKLQKIFHEVRHVRRSGPHTVQVMPCFLRKLRSVFLLKNSGEAVHVPERCAQVVRNRVAECFQLMVGLLKFFCSFFHSVFQLCI